MDASTSSVTFKAPPGGIWSLTAEVTYVSKFCPNLRCVSIVDCTARTDFPDLCDLTDSIRMIQFHNANLVPCHCNYVDCCMVYVFLVKDARIDLVGNTEVQLKKVMDEHHPDLTSAQEDIVQEAIRILPEEELGRVALEVLKM